MVIQDYWQIIKDRRQIVVLAFLATVLTTLVGSLLWPVRYEGSATIMLDYDSSNPMNMGMVAAPQAPGSGEYINTQVEIIKSRRIARRAVEILNLEKAPDMVTRFNETGSENPLFFWKKRSRIDMKRWLADNFLSNSLKVEAAKDSRFLYIKFHSPDPDISARVANAFAKAYAEYNLELKVTPFRDAEKWFSEKLKNTKGMADKATEQLREYQQKKGIIAEQGTQGTVYDDTVQRLDQINKELATAKAKLYETQVALKRVGENGGNYGSLPEVLSNTFIQDLKAQKVKLETQLTELSSKAGTNHPQYVRLRSMIDTLNSKLNAEMRTVVSAIKQERVSANQRVNTLESAVAGLKKESTSANLSRYEMDSLSRESETYKQVYEAVLKKYNETALQGDINKTNVFIVDSAVPPTSPYSPRIMFNLALAAFAGLFLGVGLAFLFDYMDDSVKSADMIERQFGIAVLGTVTDTAEI